jgi:hypothetical protein
MHLRDNARLNPYVPFESDRERRIALRNRDIRLVLISVVSALAANGSGAIQYLLSLLRVAP